MIINEETMKQGALKFIQTLFGLSEVYKVAIKDIVISSPEDMENIEKGLALCYHDKLSDVDVNAWVRVSYADFQRQTPLYRNYLKRLGLWEEIFGLLFVERSSDGSGKEGLRICLKSGFRMDFTCFVRCDEDIPDLPKEDLKQQTDIYEKQDKADAFWFIAVQALAKLLRRDYLIADHLSHMLLMEGLVLQMEERDEAYQTNFHRYGYAEKLAYRDIDISGCEKYLKSNDDTYRQIAENLCRAVLSYDKLAALASPLYQERSGVFWEIWDSYLE